MKSTLFAAAIAATLFAASAHAGGSPSSLQSIAAESGLTVRQVQMVLGAHSAFAEYRTSFDRCETKLIRTYGADGLKRFAADYQAGRLPVSAG